MSAGDGLPPPSQVVIAGHVDHGKSTLIGRLLYDTGNLQDGRLAAAEASSARRGLTIEWSFLLDSLQAERDQGVTIDSTRLPLVLDGRPFVIIDAPGHRQFLRNMLTGAADAGAAVLVVDGAEGAQEQTSRHAQLLHLVGIRRVIVALNKIDLLGFDANRIARASADAANVLRRAGIEPACLIPVSARDGDNVAVRSGRTPWHDGPSLAEALAALPDGGAGAAGPFRLPVQDVLRDGGRRYVLGRVDTGRVRVGDTVAVGVLGATARVAAIEAWSAQPQTEAVAGQSTALLLDPDVVAERGDMLHAPEHKPLVATAARARLFWLRPEPLRVGDSFVLRLATAERRVGVAAIHSVLLADDLSEHAADQVPQDGFADVTLIAPDGIVFDPFVAGGRAGRGVLADRDGRIVAAAPLLGAAAPEFTGQSIFPLDNAISPEDRARAKGHRSGVFWLTGLPASGKSTISRAAEVMLFRGGIDVVVLDGDTMRGGLTSDLGFSEADRTENMRRAAAVARMMADAGHVVLVALISPTREGRAMARQMVGTGFVEVFVDADPALCEQRDPKGLYAAARAGRITGFTGVDALYEPPEDPELTVNTTHGTVAQAAGALVAHIERIVRR